jgi:hypothetical protein
MILADKKGQPKNTLKQQHLDLSVFLSQNEDPNRILRKRQNIGEKKL